MTVALKIAKDNTVLLYYALCTLANRLIFTDEFITYKKSGLYQKDFLDKI